MPPINLSQLLTVEHLTKKYMKLFYDKANEPITRKEQQSQPPISIASEWTAPTVDNIAYPCWQGNAIRLYSWGFCPMPRPKGHGPFTKRCTALSEPNPQNRHRRFAKCCTALSELNPQKPAFGCKQLSGCIHGAPPHTPPKGTFCKKSPWESRKTAFDFYCLVFHRSLSRYQKPAYMPPPRLRRRVALDQRDASLTRKSLPSVASNYQADFCSQGIKSRRTCRRLLMDYTFCILGYLR